MSTPAGWYPDPHDPNGQRYWDGQQWTEHTAPAAAPTQPASQAPDSTPTQAGNPLPYQPQVAPASGKSSKRALLVLAGIVALFAGLFIILILIAIAAPTFLGQQNKAKDSEARQQLSIGYKVAKAVAADNEGSYRSIETVRSAIEASEPQLAPVASVDNPSPQAVTRERQMTVQQADSRGNLLLGWKSTDGTVWQLRSVAGGMPEFLADGEPSS